MESVTRAVFLYGTATRIKTAELAGLTAQMDCLLQEREEPGTTAKMYRSSLAAAVRGRWRGVLDSAGFLSSFGSSIRRGLTQAWILGAAEGGLTPADFTPAEKAELKKHIASDRLYMAGFEKSIASSTKADKAKLGPHLTRLNGWISHYWQVYAIARAMATKDAKMKFTRVRPTKKHCATCSRLENKVYRHSVWLRNDCIPPTRRTICGGYNCGHRLLPTTDRVTAGRFPASILQ